MLWRLTGTIQVNELGGPRGLSKSTLTHGTIWTTKLLFFSDPATAYRLSGDDKSDPLGDIGL